jgi:hypothetical protein
MKRFTCQTKFGFGHDVNPRLSVCRSRFQRDIFGIGLPVLFSAILEFVCAPNRVCHARCATRDPIYSPLVINSEKAAEFNEDSTLILFVGHVSNVTSLGLVYRYFSRITRTTHMRKIVFVTRTARHVTYIFPIGFLFRKGGGI